MAKRFQLDPILLLRLFMAAVMLYAAANRILFFSRAAENFRWLGLEPAPLLVAVSIAAEIVLGILLMTGRRLALAAAVLAAFISAAVLVQLAKSWGSFLPRAQELVDLTGTPTNIFMHFTYLVLAVAILLASLQKREK